MATAKKATKKATKKTTVPQPQAEPTEQAPQPNGGASLVNVTTEEFYNFMSQVYPDQSARAVAEIKSVKLEQVLREMGAIE